MTPSNATKPPAAPQVSAPANAAGDANTKPNSDASAVGSPKGPDWWRMLRAFIQQGKRIASFAPSSVFMARKILSGIDWASARAVVELGAGTGPITAELIKVARPDTKLIVIELDPTLGRRLRDRFRHVPNLEIILGDATRLDELLAARGIQQVDHVVSGLPLPSFPEEARDKILEVAAQKLAPGGTFRQLTVMPLIYYKLYRRYFDNVRFRFVPVNLPPGGVYVCRGYRGTPKSESK